MAGDLTHEQGLETCITCNRPFVVPVSLLDIVDEGLYLLVLHCTAACYQQHHSEIDTVMQSFTIRSN